ncbi:MAG: phosphohydrolase [Firmicutes bacterium]|nr:phosphohydrolase [Bacillota bacterium]
MQFKKIEELKVGMRLARPIYNRNGVLLYERNSKLTQQGISSIKNFGLIGLFILEPAEPVPPMSAEDIEFERFQTINVFAIMDELERIVNNGRAGKLQIIVSNIIKSYGHLDKKINFIQNLRSREDYQYKHALNVAILCAMISNKLNLKIEERLDVVTAALLYDLRDSGLIEKICSSSPNVKRFCHQAETIGYGIEDGKIDPSVKLMEGGKILAVSQVFDKMTAMNMEQPPESEVAAIRYLLGHPEFFSKDVVNALMKSINILSPGVCVELNIGEKALVLAENEYDIFCPMVLVFSDNSVLDLADRSVYGDVEITDVMKTMDNRYVMDTETLKKYGLNF